MAINILDSYIINRISAGEVVESPFSIVKELIDNSLDAGADNITVEIKNGGIDQIIVKDNGKGIDENDIIKAFLPHATSKIKNVEDLESISTLGFRGEALASISNVTQTCLTTKTKQADCAFKIEINGGKFGEVEPTTLDCGTRIEVNNLFFNTPARRKFLKKPKQEENQITNIMARYILANPSIKFKYIVDNQVVYQTSGQTLQDAIYCVYGTEITQNIMPVEKKLNNLQLKGYISKIGFSKPNTTYQTLIINGRYVIDEIVSKAVYMAFEEYLMTRQFPFFVLNITMPNVDIDVNVHPSKINVKFAHPSNIYDLVYTACRAAIYNSLNQTKEQPTEHFVDNASSNIIKTDLNSLKEIEIEPNTKFSPNNSNVVLRQTAYSPITFFDLKNENTDGKTNETIIDNTENKTITNNIQNNLSNTNNIEENTYKDVSNFVDFKIVGELFNEFIVLEKGNNLILLDFHAGHERLNYDKFTAMVNSRDVVIQQLLVPYIHEVNNIELNFIMELKPELTELGFDIEQFGENKIIIHTIPMQLKDINLKGFVDDLLHDMKNLKPKMNNEIRHYLMQKACKSSVKSGMRLTEMEIKELLKNLDENNPVLLCPHGRPVITVISRSQIEKWFKRLVWTKF